MNRRILYCLLYLAAGVGAGFAQLREGRSTFEAARDPGSEFITSLRRSGDANRVELRIDGRLQPSDLRMSSRVATINILVNNAPHARVRLSLRPARN
jgi:hypothetical protein